MTNLAQELEQLAAGYIAGQTFGAQHGDSMEPIVAATLDDALHGGQGSQLPATEIKRLAQPIVDAALQQILPQWVNAVNAQVDQNSKIPTPYKKLVRQVVDGAILKFQLKL